MVVQVVERFAPVGPMGATFAAAVAVQGATAAAVAVAAAAAAAVEAQHVVAFALVFGQVGFFAQPLLLPAQFPVNCTKHMELARDLLHNVPRPI